MLTPRRARWRAALLTGLLSGTFSTILITLGAPRIGRGRALDWMEIGTVLLGVDSVVRHPGWPQIAAGVFVHQSADLFIGPRAGPTASAQGYGGPPEPWRRRNSRTRPTDRLRRPGLALQTRHSVAAAEPAAPKQAAQAAAKAGAVYVLAAVVAVLLAVEMSVKAGWEPRIEVGDRDDSFDRTFMRHMRAHHEVGVWLADLSSDRSARIHVQELGRLMVANQRAEIETLDGWWRRWFGGRIPPVPREEHRQIPGMPSGATMRQLEQFDGVEFERRFFPVMIDHHRGAVLMADGAWQNASDVRLRMFAESLRHAQRGQIERMEELQKEEP